MPVFATPPPPIDGSMAHTAGLAKNAAGQVRTSQPQFIRPRRAFCNCLREVEGYEVFIKFLPPSASASSLKNFFGEDTLGACIDGFGLIWFSCALQAGEIAAQMQRRTFSDGVSCW